MRSLIRPILFVGLGLVPVLSHASSPVGAVSPEAQRLVQQAEAACAAFEDGSFDPQEAVQQVVLRHPAGDVSVELVDESAFLCSTAASLYCGSGGCMLHAIVGLDVRSWQVTGWRVLSWGPSDILLLGRDGGWCGGSGAEVCFEAVTWSEGRPLTVGPAPDTP